MTDQKKCVRCSRAIDAWSRICPFCNQDQNEPVPAVTSEAAEVVEYRAPDEREAWKHRIAIFAAGILLLIASFGVGMIINSDGTPDDAPEPVAEKPADVDRITTGKRADTQLVPVGEPIAQPITSAPVAQPDANIPTEYQRHDATAVSSVEYQQLAARAQAERRAAAQFVDPRSITGRAYAQGSRPRRTLASPPTTRVPSTHPVAEYQPIPPIRVDQPMAVRLNLTVGPDGRVEQVAMQGGAGGRGTREILSTVRRWRYKPATVNGRPVSAPVTVDISFNPNE